MAGFTKGMESFVRSIEYFLKKTGSLESNDHLRYGSYAIVETRVVTFRMQTPIQTTGYVIGAQNGSRGPTLWITFEDKEFVEQFIWKSSYGEGPFGYFLSLKYKIWTHLVDWQNVLSIQNKEFDFSSMLTNDNPDIRRLAKNLFDGKLK